MVAFDNSSCGNMIYRKSRRLNTTSSILAKLYLFKVNNDNDVIQFAWRDFTHCSSISIADFEQINAGYDPPCFWACCIENTFEYLLGEWMFLLTEALFNHLYFS